MYPGPCSKSTTTQYLQPLRLVLHPVELATQTSTSYIDLSSGLAASWPVTINKDLPLGSCHRNRMPTDGLEDPT